MDKTYADTVRLLLAVAPDVFANDIFAMKGGTAINLFVRDMPRLSVDIDVVYLPWQTPRDEALQTINQELAAIATRVAPLGVQTRLVRAKDLGDTKLIVENDASQVKIEVNAVFRGSVLPVERRPLSARTSDLFGVEFDLPVLAPDELYASKLVAALDRQHPRDLFDVWQLFESGDISDGMVECFVVYLAGHNRPPHEVLFGNDKDIAGEYERAFVGMTEVSCSLETLLDARARLQRNPPPSTPAWARADEHPAAPHLPGLPHAAFIVASTKQRPYTQRLPTKAKGLGRGKGRAPRGKALS
ncbi:nucleotidyl transferase AbiEii/AbiGii toxin family protein [Thauera aromatica]|uniref:nucleotidyl transferase AbiEii/AbiGii toxin family protein n=1 Tax=Thauera aromatica TaxID=59405 RepID=UPI0031E6F74C